MKPGTLLRTNARIISKSYHNAFIFGLSGEFGGKGTHIPNNTIVLFVGETSHRVSHLGRNWIDVLVGDKIWSMVKGDLEELY